ncbi:MAG: alkaline phosphatase D family protein [Pseudomonadales bacterium]|nr:alkaline phosphatase D family protein [Pseudomonadales bacterium]
MSLSRRSLFKAAAGGATLASVTSLQGCLGSIEGPFKHGVASGDPLADRVILWTRITSEELTTDPLAYEWWVAADSEMKEIVLQGSGSTGPERDYTVKLDVSGLEPNTTYYYQFAHGEWRSQIGRTKTLPMGSVEHVRLAFTSCSWYTAGYFNVYRTISEYQDIDAVLHLGDYIYEYGNDLVNPFLVNRLHSPAHHIVSLQDYRMRHAQYKTDPDLMEAHRQHPFITIWDDHESANNSYDNGAENHEEDQGPWPVRRANAIRAYFEWMPIRETGLDHNQDQLVYRNFRFGDLLNLSMLDTRLVGRDKQAVPGDLITINDPTRSLLGDAQQAWLFDQMANAQADGVTWKVLGQQVMMAQLAAGYVSLNMDQWDGYPVARQQLFDFIKSEGIDNFCVLTGDIHSSWANDIQEDPFTNTEILGVEFVTPGVTSPSIPVKPVSDRLSAELVKNMPHMHHVDFFHKGHVLLDITKDHIQGEWYYAESVNKTADSFFAKAYRANVSGGGLSEVAEPSLGKSAAAFAPMRLKTQLYRG